MKMARNDLALVFEDFKNVKAFRDGAHTNYEARKALLAAIDAVITEADLIAKESA